MSYFLEIYVEGPWDTYNLLRGPSSGMQVSDTSQFWTDKVDAAVNSSNSLVLKFGDWSEDAGKIASLLKLTDPEHKAFLETLGHHYNSAPAHTQELNVKSSNFQRLRKATELLFYLARRLAFHFEAFKRSEEVLSVLHAEHSANDNDLHLTLHLDDDEEVESYALSY